MWNEQKIKWYLINRFASRKRALSSFSFIQLSVEVQRLILPIIFFIVPSVMFCRHLIFPLSVSRVKVRRFFFFAFIHFSSEFMRLSGSPLVYFDILNYYLFTQNVQKCFELLSVFFWRFELLFFLIFWTIIYFETKIIKKIISIRII